MPIPGRRVRPGGRRGTAAAPPAAADAALGASGELRPGRSLSEILQ